MDPQDEFTHPVGDHPSWSESYYFNFVDPDTEVGMFARMGLRANEGTVDGLVGIYLGGHRVAFIYARERLPGDDSLRAGGLSLERVEPFRRWEISYDGPAQDIADDSILITRRRERPEGWFTPAEAKMSLTFESIHDPYYTPGGGEHGHFEQAGRVKGTVAVGDDRWTVDGFGVRDKSWGPRTWQAGGGGGGTATGASAESAPRPFVNWFSMNFGAGYALGASCGLRDGDMRGSGWVLRGGRNYALNDVRVVSEFEHGTILHKHLRLTGIDEGGHTHDVTGNLITVTPTKIAMPGGGATFVNEGLARFTTGGITGFGIAEYWHAVPTAD